MKISAFLSKVKDTQVLTITNGEATIQTSSSSKGKDEHFCVLEVLIDVLESIKNCDLVFYSGDNIVAFEYEVEYKQKHCNINELKDKKMWLKIIELCKKKNINLKIKGEDDVLSSLNKKFGE